MKRSILFTILFCALSSLSLAQNNTNQNSTAKSSATGFKVGDFCPKANNPYMAPPSPEVASFLKYGDYPVAYNTGIPDISFPVYTINTRELTFPIVLSYYAGGLKVGEASSWVGLGWTLKAEGAVNYTIQGLPDQVSFDLPTSDELRNSKDVSTLGKIFSFAGTLSKIDRMKDRYDYSFAEQKGIFMMKDADKSIQFPYTTNKIERIHSENGVVTQGLIITY